MRFALLILTLLIVAPLSLAASPFDTASQPFQADLYPSKKSAIDGLLFQAIRELREDPNFNANSITFQLSSEIPVTAITSAFPTSRIKQASEPKPADQSLAISVMVGGNDVGLSIAGAKLSARTYTAKFVSKGWADDWAVYLNDNSKGRWMRGVSPQPGATSDEAVLSARLSAAKPLAALVQAELNARASRFSGTRFRVTSEWIEKRVGESLLRPSNDGLVVKDTFMQKFTRPYGDVWLAQVLIDASPKIVGQLADSYANAARSEFGAKIGGIGAVGAMVIVILLLYFFINAVTQGYFLWRLRAVALLTAMAGLLVFLSWI